MRCIALLLLLAAAYAAEQTPVYLCGRQLANAREWICYGQVIKRGPLHNMLDDVMYEDKEYNSRPWSGRRGALSADWTRYKRDGIVDECCIKPCTTDVILNYC